MTAPAANLPATVVAPTSEMAQLTDAVNALALPADDTSQRWHLRNTTAAWLRSKKSRLTRIAYFKDLNNYLAWCERTGLDPRDARRSDIDVYAATALTGLSPSSTARKLSSVSSWYKYLLSNELTTRNPLDAVTRPASNRDSSPTIGLTGQQAGAFMRAARARTGPAGRRDTALLGMLAELGLRVGEAINLDVANLRHNRGHRAVRVTGKGGHIRELPIPAPLGRDLDTYLAHRAAAAGVPVDELDGPLFTTTTGRRVDQPAVFRLVRQVAKAAGIPDAGKLSPHSLRHTAATASLDAGSPLRDVQDMLGHSDPRTTRRYDRSRGSLDRSPVYLIAHLFAHNDDDEVA